jgi:membrane-bound serine protease (ClpP class)
MSCSPAALGRRPRWRARATGPTACTAGAVACLDRARGQVGRRVRPPPSVEILPLRGGFIDPPVAAQIRDVLELAERGRARSWWCSSTPRPAGCRSTSTSCWPRSRLARCRSPVLVGPLGSGRRRPVRRAAVAGGGRAGRLARRDVGPARPGRPHRRRRHLPRGHADGGVRDRGRRRPEAADGCSPRRSRRGPRRRRRGHADRAGARAAAGRARRHHGRRHAPAIRADEVEVRFHSLGLVRRLLHAATTAPFIYLLLVVGLGMLLFEVFQPGFGVAGLAGSSPRRSACSGCGSCRSPGGRSRWWCSGCSCTPSTPRSPGSGR